MDFSLKRQPTLTLRITPSVITATTEFILRARPIASFTTTFSTTQSTTPLRASLALAGIQPTLRDQTLWVALLLVVMRGLNLMVPGSVKHAQMRMVMDFVILILH